jgi:hypothetical protein
MLLRELKLDAPIEDVVDRIVAKSPKNSFELVRSVLSALGWIESADGSVWEWKLQCRVAGREGRSFVHRINNADMRREDPFTVACATERHLYELCLDHIRRSGWEDERKND